MKNSRNAWLTLLWAGLCCCLLSGRAPAQDREKASSKPAPRVIVLGHATHGKTTLTAAITRILSTDGKARFSTYDELKRPGQIDVQGVNVEAARVRYETPKAYYVHIDCRDEAEIRKLLSANGVKIDGAILVVGANDGPMPQTLAQVRLARKSGIRSMVVYLNKVDVQNDPELLQLVEREIREMLTANGFGNAPIIRGSALAALRGSDKKLGEDSIRSLLAAMDQQFVR